MTLKCRFFHELYIGLKTGSHWCQWALKYICLYHVYSSITGDLGSPTCTCCDIRTGDRLGHMSDIISKGFLVT